MNAMRKQMKYQTDNPNHSCRQQPDTQFKMAFLLLMVMLTACAATIEDLSGKMLYFPGQSSTTYVRLIPSRQTFTVVTVCLRFYTHLRRDFSLFSLASSVTSDDFLIYRKASSEEISVTIKNHTIVFGRQDVKLNKWHSVCSTWDPNSDLAELWFDGKPSNRRSVKFGSIIGPIIITTGQDQDSYGGGFDSNQSFVGKISDMHMWDYALSPCEIRGYMNQKDFPPGNLLNWRALEFLINGKVLIQPKNC